jgi:hypothetical protein
MFFPDNVLQGKKFSSVAYYFIEVDKYWRRTEWYASYHTLRIPLEHLLNCIAPRTMMLVSMDHHPLVPNLPVNTVIPCWPWYLLSMIHAPI